MCFQPSWLLIGNSLGNYDAHPINTLSPLTIGATVLKESDALNLFGVAFDSNMTFENYMSLVSRVAYQRLV